MVALGYVIGLVGDMRVNTSLYIHSRPIGHVVAKGRAVSKLQSNQAS